MLDWLNGEPADDCLEDLDQLCRHLGRMSDEALPAEALYPLLEPLAARVMDIAGRMRPRLLGAGLPLPHALHEATARLTGVMVDGAAMAGRLGEALGRSTGDGEAASVTLAAHGLTLLAEAYKLACMAAIDAVPGLWQRACGLCRSLEHGKRGTRAEGIEAFKQMVAIATLQPESLSARELAWLFDFLGAASSETELSDHVPRPDNASFWIDCAADGPPVARIRRAPPADAELLHFHAFALARRLGEQIDWLECRIADAEVIGQERDADLLDPESSGLPLGLTPAEVLSLLRRMRERWTTPPNRTLPRRAQDYVVQVCAGLGPIWRMLRRGEDAATISEWTVNNESPGGYAIIGACDAGASAGAVGAGTALALRRDASQPWVICIVRWVRSERPGVMELGLQAVGQGCSPISVGFRGDEFQRTAPALLLPPLAGLRRHHAILAPAGTYTSRRFVLVRDGRQLYVAQGRVLNLEMQTASVELFQYEIDPYAL
ncbi:MAG TPA: hypothetical protein PL143_10710 [Rhodocyclaceae bacterium]|nr:hypothetical protein [Rhodocyclaceae bacterium]